MKLKDLFRRKKSMKCADGIEKVEVNRIEVEKADVERIDIPKTSPLAMIFRNTKTGEIRLVEFGDHEGFDECVGNKDMQLIFG